MASTAGTQGVLEAAVEPLNQAVTLRMVCSCWHVVDVEQHAEGGPHRGGELRASVRGQDRWDAKA